MKETENKMEGVKGWLVDMLRVPEGAEVTVENGVPSFVAEAPAPETFDYVRHYTEDAEQFDYFGQKDEMTAMHLSLLRHSVVKEVPTGDGAVLDVGCGCAYVARHFCPKGRRVVSLDVAKANAHKALAEYPFENHAAVVADAFHLPFADGTFDSIVASEIIEHTVDPQAFLASLVSKLKPGGTLVVSTPYKERIAYSLCIHCNCKTPHNAHLHSFDEAKMRRLVAPLPAEVVRMRLVGNKLLLHSHLSVLLSKLGMGFWSAFDRMANKVVPKVEHFVIVIRKNG